MTRGSGGRIRISDTRHTICCASPMTQSSGTASRIGASATSDRGSRRLSLQHSCGGVCSSLDCSELCHGGVMGSADKLNERRMDARGPGPYEALSTFVSYAQDYED